MSLIRVLIIFLLGGYLFPCPGFGKELSLSLALEKVESAPSMQASRHQAGASQADADIVRGMFYPHLQITHGYGYTNNPVGVFGTKLQQRRFAQGDFAIPLLNNPKAVSSWQTRFQLTQPILNSWVDIQNQKAATKMAEAGEAEHRFHISQMRLDVEKLYWTIVAFQKVQEVYREGIGKLLRLEKSYQLMEAPTSATTTNFLITQSVRFDLEARLKGIESGTENAKNLLSKILALPGKEPLVLSDPLPKVAQWKAEASESEKIRSDVQAMEKKSQAAEAGAKSKQGTWLPRLDFVGGYNLFTGDYTFMETAYDLGVQLTWDVFQGPRLGQIRKAKQEEAAARHFTHALTLRASAEKENSLRDLESRVSEFNLIQEASRRAGQALRIAKKRYSQGTLPLFDYSQALQNWVQVQEGLVMAQRRVAEAHADLGFQRGME